MSLVIEAPETPSEAIPPTLDDVPALATSSPVLPAQPQTSPSWWQTVVKRFSQRQAPSQLGDGPIESAIDRLAREQPFLYIKVLSG